VLRLLDARTGSYTEVSPARPGLLRVCAHVPETAGNSVVAGLRVLLVTDLLARTAELGNLQVLTTVVANAPSGQASALDHAAGALGIHPPAARVGRGSTPVLLGDPIDVHLVGHGAAADDRQTGLVMRVGDARIRRAGDRGEETGEPPVGYEHDPLAVRLALMSFPIGQSADLTESVLASAHRTAGDWRRRVARWAERPSRPIPAHLAQMAQAAFGDLDTPSVIALLRGLADDDGVPEGTRFEMFLYVDRVLGLDLPRDIGKPS
jgi:hypothetical protein